MPTTVDLSIVKKMREQTGIGFLDCKNALIKSGGDIDAAIKQLRSERGHIERRSGKPTSQGLVYSYIHPGEQIGVTVELNCETDFVARTEEFKELAHNLAMHVAFAKPTFVAPANIPDKVVKAEEEFQRSIVDSKKPPEIVEKIVAGRIQKWYADTCLLEQPFVKDDTKTVRQVIEEMITKTGENIKVKRFVRFAVGEEAE